MWWDLMRIFRQTLVVCSPISFLLVFPVTNMNQFSLIFRFQSKDLNKLRMTSALQAERVIV